MLQEKQLTASQTVSYLERKYDFKSKRKSDKSETDFIVRGRLFQFNTIVRLSEDQLEHAHEHEHEHENEHLQRQILMIFLFLEHLLLIQNPSCSVLKFSQHLLEFKQFAGLPKAAGSRPMMIISN